MGKSIAAASCLLLLLGGAGTARSFVAPESRTRIRPHNPHPHLIGTSSSLGARGNAEADATTESGKVEKTSGILDQLWAKKDVEAITLMEDNTQLMMLDDDDEGEDETSATTKYVLIGGTALVVAAAGALAVTLGNDLGIDLELGQLIEDPSASFDLIVKALESMSLTKGLVYFSSFYVLAEILAIPAVPILTASSGYLFGALPGTAACLFSAAVAASVSFVIGRTLLRGYVEKVLDGNPKFRCMDKAIEKEGFKLMLLLRLSPLFPFALSNYLYGASSIRFLPYFFGTLLGFAPGTFAYVYAGRIGKALTMDSATSGPWYAYVGGLAVVVALIKIAGDVASGVIDAMEEDCEV